MNCYTGRLGFGEVKIKRCDTREVDGEATVITGIDRSVWAILLSSWNPTLKGMICNIAIGFVGPIISAASFGGMLYYMRRVCLLFSVVFSIT